MCFWAGRVDKRGLQGVETHPNSAFKKPCTVSKTRFSAATTSINLRTACKYNALRPLILRGSLDTFEHTCL